MTLARLKLWEHVEKDGELRVYVKTSRLVTRRDGGSYIDEADAETVTSHLDGYEVLNPELKIGIRRRCVGIKEIGGRH